jgi:F-type H+-transporting ATPase subunit epsilon
MPNAFRLQVVTQQGVVFDRQVEALRACSVEGYFGIRPGHAPMVVQLAMGRIMVREPKQDEKALAYTGGVLEVSGEGVVILADVIEDAHGIDVERARKAAERARERLRRRADEGIDPDRAAIALARALNRLKAAQRGG